MTLLVVFLGAYAALATIGWMHNLDAAESWRRAFMAERGCDVKEPRLPRWRLRLIWWAHMVLPLGITKWHFCRLSEATREALIESDFWPHKPKAEP